jgi:hypothetical protein
MATNRHSPGAPAPHAGTYALIDRSGALLGCAKWCEEGEALPKVLIAAGMGSSDEVWWQLRRATKTQANAA